MVKDFTYKVNLDAETGQLTNKLKIVNDQLANLGKSGAEPAIGRTMAALSNRLDELMIKARTPIRTATAFGPMEKDLTKMGQSVQHLIGELTELRKTTSNKKLNVLPPDTTKVLLAAAKGLDTFTKAKEAAEVSTKALTDAQTAYTKALRAQADIQSQISGQTAAYQKALAEQKAAEQALNEAKATGDQSAIDDAQRAFNEAKKTATAFASTLSTLKVRESAAATAVNQCKDALGDQQKAFDKAKSTKLSEAFSNLVQVARNAGISLEGLSTKADGTLKRIPANINKIEDRLKAFIAGGFVQADNQIDEITRSLREMNAAIEEGGEGLKRESAIFKEQNDAANDVSGIVNRIKQFTGLTGVALTMRRALQSAIATTKELDKQMTEMAVVTDLEVGDYWKQLPEHTARANALGLAIKDVYEAETLYYQQGLKAAEVTALSTSTLKMARIASLSAEDATNKMTAALRGFNMEINETNADRIADVYSKLAAITASDVEEISTAMTKTASLASNAGMEFETTAAFLAQIIETTRESAETAGTAMKTVIARFQELKKAPEEIGEVDGEIVDANKIETALRTVGVALRDELGQFRALDEVFLELSSKWQSLDTNTQRYIATIAAGSRQQSRFIAMMSNYQRTAELVKAANTAAGASNEQFEKTLDSLQSKLSKLKNAWDTFTQGLANNEFIKVGVDVLTGLMTAVNKLTEGWDAWSSSALKIGLVTGALTLGGKALKIFTDAMAKASAGMGIFSKMQLGFAAVGEATKDRLQAMALGVKNLGKGLSATGEKLKKFTYDHLTEQEALRLVVKAQQEYNATLSQTSRTLQDTSGWTQAEKQSLYGLQIATLDYCKILGLTEGASRNVVNLVAEGIPIDQAAALAKEGLTAEIIKQKLAIDSLNGALSNEQMSQLGVTMSSGASGLGGMFKKMGQTLGRSKAEWQQWFSNIGQGFKDLWSGVKTFFSNFGAAIGWFALAAAALAGTIAGIVAIVKAFHKNSPAGQLELAAQRAQELAQAAEEASNRFATLTEKFETFSNASDNIANLVKGTQEWKTAVLEVNQQYLDLIKLYPELAKLETTTKNGYIEFVDTDAAQNIVNQASTVKLKAQGAATNAQLEQLRRQQDVDFSKLSNKAKVGHLTGAGWGAWGAIAGSATAGGAGTGAAIGAGIGSLPAPAIGTAAGAGIGAVVGAAVGLVGGTITAFATGAIKDAKDAAELSQKTLTDQLARELVGAGDMTQEQIEQWLKDQGADVSLAKDLVSVQSELRAYGESLIEAEEATRAYIAAFRQQVLNTIDSSQYNNNQLTQMGTLLTDTFIEHIEEKIDAQIEEAGDHKNDLRDNSLLAKEYEKYFRQQYGNSVIIGKHGSVSYTDEEGQSQTITSETAQAAFATSKAMDEFKKRAELLSKTLAHAGDNIEGLNDAFNKAYLNEEGLGLTRAAKDNLTEDNLSHLWNTETELRQIYDTYDEFVAEMKKRREGAEQAFKDNTEELYRIGLRSVSLDQNLTAEAEKGLVNRLRQVTALHMDGGGEAMANSIQNLLNTIAVDERSEVAKILGSTNWHNADELEALPDLLKAMGKTVPTEELEAFINDAKVLANAVHNINLAKLNESLISINKGLQDIRTNDQQRIFEKDLYETLIAANADLKQYFRQNLEGKFIFLGSNMSQLTDAVLKNTDALVEERVRILSNSQGTRAILDDMAAQGGDVRQWAFWGKKKQLNFLEQLQNNAIRNGVELGDTNEYLSNNTALDILTPQMIKSIFTSLVGLGTVDAIQKEIDQEAVAARVTGLLRNNASLNTYTNYSQAIARGKTLNTDDQTSFVAAREALLIQAQDNGISEQDYKQLAQYNELLKTYEERRITDTKEYRQVVNDAIDAVNKLRTKSSFQTMYDGMRQNVSAAHELVEAYNATTSAMEKTHLVSQMVSEFQLEVTEENTEKYAQYVEALTYGSEEALENLVNLSGYALTNTTEIYSAMGDKTTEEIRANLGEAGLAFMRAMEDAKYGWLETQTVLENGMKKTVQVWHWGTAEMQSLAKEITGSIEGWLNPYDWLYNATQKINTELYQRQRLERQWSNALEDNNKTVSEMADILKGEVAITRSVADEYTNVYEQAERELTEYVQHINKQGLPGFTDAFVVGPDGRIIANKDALFSVDLTNEAGSLGEEEVNRITALIDTMRDAEDKVNEANKYLREIQKTGQSEYSSLIERVTDALQQRYQREIDTMASIHDAVTDAAASLVDKMQEKIDDDRQARENEKTRQELSDKQAQLSYLQASGSNQLEVLKAQKDLADSQEAYTDTLVDQSIDELSRANEAAAAQRQEQIDIAQAQYDWWAEHDAIHDAEQVVNQSLIQVADKVTATNSALGDLLIAEENVGAKHKDALDEWTKSLEIDTKLATIYAGLDNNTPTSVQQQIGQTNSNINSLNTELVGAMGQTTAQAETIAGKFKDYTEGEKTLLTKEDLTTLTVDADAQKNWWFEKLKSLKFVVKPGENGDYRIEHDDGSGGTTGEDITPPVTPRSVHKPPLRQGEYTEYTDTSTQFAGSAKWHDIPIASSPNDASSIDLEIGGQLYGAEWGPSVSADLGGFLTRSAPTVLTPGKTLMEYDGQLYLYGYNNTWRMLRQSGYIGAESISDLIKKFNSKEHGGGGRKFASGGLADFTGPAWMDGTTSAPELVLNATDTANFIELKNLLADAFKDGQSTTSLGNNYYDIDVHVDNIDSDYDIDSAAAHMKELIEAEAMYRNVNAIQRTR